MYATERRAVDGVGTYFIVSVPIRYGARVFGDRQAMSMGFGGNPYGPAGTGKTESVKALGYLFGRQVLVFNCDEGIDIKSLTRILIGLARCGAWGCFDEFNRLEDSTLSMISTRIHPIQEAIKNKETSFVLENQKVNVPIEPFAGHHSSFSSDTLLQCDAYVLVR